MVKSFYQQAEMTGNVPSPLETKPELWLFNEKVWKAWTSLHTARQIGGMGPCGLSINDMVTYFTFTGKLSTSVMKDYIYLIQEMDRAWMDRWVTVHNAKVKKK